VYPAWARGCLVTYFHHDGVGHGRWLGAETVSVGSCETKAWCAEAVWAGVSGATGRWEGRGDFLDFFFMSQHHILGRDRQGGGISMVPIPIDASWSPDVTSHRLAVPWDSKQGIIICIRFRIDGRSFASLASLSSCSLAFKPSVYYGEPHQGQQHTNRRSVQPEIVTFCHVAFFSASVFNALYNGSVMIVRMV